jgi:hypothetical protein
MQRNATTGQIIAVVFAGILGIFLLYWYESSNATGASIARGGCPDGYVTAPIILGGIAGIQCVPAKGE